MWELDYKESWPLKNSYFWTVVLEKTLESPLDFKEIQPVHPNGNQSWIFNGRTDTEAETPILWPPHAKSWLIWKDPDAGKDWGQEEKGTTEDEMAGWHHWLNGCAFEQDPRVGDGQGSLAWCSPWGSKRVGHNWANELNWLFKPHRNCSEMCPPVDCESTFHCLQRKAVGRCASRTQWASWAQVASWARVHKLQDIMSDNLRWSWYNNNRNKMHSNHNVLESSPNHPPCPWSMEKLSSMKLVPSAKKVGGRHSRALENDFWGALPSPLSQRGLGEPWGEHLLLHKILPVWKHLFVVNTHSQKVRGSQAQWEGIHLTCFKNKLG